MANPAAFVNVDTKPVLDIIEASKSAEAALLSTSHEPLEIIGLVLLSYASIDYQLKARGGMGRDGISWAPNKPSTIRRKLNKGTSNKPRTGPKGRYGSTVRPALGSVEIGVDQGLQRASASPGFQGPDGKGGSSFSFDNTKVTVGFNRSYSGFFDEKRPLLPDDLPKAWEEEVASILLDWAQTTTQEFL